VLVSLSADKTTTALIGLGVAILTGLDSFLQLGPRWQQHRQAATKIGFEGWQFAALAGPYSGKGRAAAYLEFMTNLERLNQSLESTYFELFKAEASKPPDRDVPANDHAGTRKERDEDDDAGATDT